MGGMSASTLLLLNCDEAAEEIGLSPERIRQFCRGGRLGQRVGGRWVILQEELNRFRKIPRPSGRPSDSGRN
jgi:hypothetical protein